MFVLKQGKQCFCKWTLPFYMYSWWWSL